MFHCDSEDALKALIMKECPSGKGLAAFVDPVSLFAHDAEGETTVGNHKLLSSAGLTKAVDCRCVNSFCKRYNAKYVASDSVPVLGKKITVFTSLDNWRGIDGLDGARSQINKTVESSKDSALAYAADYLPAGSKMMALAKDMIQFSAEFHGKMHAHFEQELVKLMQLKIPKDEALKLVSNQYLMIHNKLFDTRKLCKEYEEDIDPVDFMVRSVWISLRATMLAQGFVANGIENHTAIASSFLRFLTKQTGSNVSAGVGGQLDTLKAELVEEIRKVAGAAKGAQILADKNVEALKDLFKKNKTLVK